MESFREATDSARIESRRRRRIMMVFDWEEVIEEWCSAVIGMGIGIREEEWNDRV